jgi:lysophospholipase L1-like esterase
MKALHARYEVRAETSSYTPTWAGKMKRLIANTQPDLVIITLGANEVGTPDPQVHAYAVREIVHEIGGRPCVWVSPPLWREDTGMVEMIRENTAPCRFFDSDKLVPVPIPRQRDKIHPTPAGGAIWADAFWQWLEAERIGGVDASGKPRPWALKPAPPGEHGSGPARE